MLMLLLLFAHTKWPDVVFRNYDGSNLSRGGLKLKKKKEGGKIRNEWSISSAVCLPRSEKWKRKGEILDGILTFSPPLCGGREGGGEEKGGVDEGLKNSKVRGIKKRNLITSWNGISSYRLTDIWYFMRNARRNFPRWMEFYDSRGNKFSSFPFVRALPASLKKIWKRRTARRNIIIRLLWFISGHTC